MIVALGVANVLADGFSMAAANYSGTKADQDNARRLRKIEERHIREEPAGEWREARAILAQLGLDGDLLDRATDAVTADRERWIRLMLEGEYGLGGTEPHPLRAALATFGAFLVAGMVPLLPFLFGLENAFRLSVVATMATFFLIGMVKSHWSPAPWWRSGGETFLIGGAAASIAYLVGSMFEV